MEGTTIIEILRKGARFYPVSLCYYVDINQLSKL